MFTRKQIVAGAVVWLLSATSVLANTVTFNPSVSNVQLNDIFTVDIVGTDFTSGTDGGGVNVSFDPSILNVLSVSLDSVWDIWADTGTIDNTSGTVTGIDFATFSNLPSSFTIGTLQLKATGTGSSTLGLTESFGIGGFALGGSSQTVSFQDGTVNVSTVPLPASVFLLLSGLLPMLGRMRRRNTAA
jgi:hypothetical protein